mmetsp:Transcript_39953/g.65463  ORF Transcript_39953/g.65463 Transcript_39953/m.65463 type:complete len:310 (+) Transcript_39953:139-1068(+)|eukprot:CAMPEP_0194582142 /NCGR_PEP_ID=MMETSP0292-20121207/15384_1 /TAXON_ID=39354 /ORGANISM="Heterosigma akashiwo, Strain CCMP2393" /LENGTH=309 /DNA_ID=CAMNT_0039436149 /DNA_START=123 /DNA_END=1049 /DNA_ORIENTATION=+
MRPSIFIAAFVLLLAKSADGFRSPSASSLARGTYTTGVFSSPRTRVLKNLSVLEREQVVETPAADPKPRRKGPEPELAIEGDSLEDSPVTIGITAAFWVLAFSLIGCYIMAIQTPAEAITMGATFLFSTVFSDFFSGVFHWSVDNYGNGKTPLLGSVIEAFQGHHSAPWTITYRPFANNVHKICKVAIPIALIANALPLALPAKLFTVLWLCFQVLSQEFHKLSHMVNPPAWAQVLQEKNVIISRKVHGLHHSSPFEGNYCILTGWCNQALDQSRLFRGLEKLVYQWNGVEPNCWKLDPKVKAEALALW